MREYSASKAGSVPPRQLFCQTDKTVCAMRRHCASHRIAGRSNHRFIAGSVLQKEMPSEWMASLFGAGYGNRTRLCGLGSDHSTDELTLRFLYYIRKGGQFQYPFCIQDPTSGSRPQRAKDRQKHLTAFEINCGQVKIRDNNSNSKSNRKSKSVRIRVSKRKKKRKTNNKNICAESCPKRERER